MQLIALFYRARGILSTLTNPGSMRALLVITIILFAASLQAQTVTLSVRDVPVETVFKEIRKQTGYTFVYTRDQLKQARPLSLSFDTAPLITVLDACVKEQPFTYTINNQHIVLHDKKPAETKDPRTTLTGKVINDAGEAIAGAIITLASTGKSVATGNAGEFTLEDVGDDATLRVSCTGYQTLVYRAGSVPGNIIRLVTYVNTLDETLVIAYGSTTKRLNTGAVAKVSKEAIANQPVTNVLAALHGRVPGVTVTQQNGIPGAAVKIQVRGRTSINTTINNDPLFIIDGIPFAPNNSAVNQVGSSLGSGGLSPFNSINPSDIESIEVLKDADATAIYGSRGANGVILITTKKGKAGKTTTSLNIREGFSKANRMMDYMDTRQYISMRREAFANDGIVPQANPSLPGYAPDLTIWDTTRYTDFKKMLLGNTARFTDIQLSVSGGNTNTQFLLGTGYARQSTVFPGNLADKRGSFHLNLHHQSTDKKLSVVAGVTYGFDDNNINSGDLTSYLRLVPNLPALFDSTGKLQWQQGGVTYENPMAYSLRTYNSEMENLLGNLQVTYLLAHVFAFTTNIGFNNVAVRDRSTTPISSLNPATNPLGSASFGNSVFRSIIAEPQLKYTMKMRKLKVDMLVGATWQSSYKEGSLVNGTGYNNDALLGTLKAAGNVTVVKSETADYRYAATFGRATFNLRDKYLLNITGRRDGSSRFGPGKRYANFKSVGMAWLFGRESFIQENVPSLSFGKLRFSYGTTGNDKIGDYAYVSTYTSSGATYQGVPGINPSALFNPNYAWELNNKMEAAIETGFWKDKLRLSVAFYYNKSSNQLINYSLPTQTGAQSIVANFPATVENKGWEMEAAADVFHTKNWEWSLSANLTIPSNRLAAFPGFEASSYASYLVLGQPLNISGGYRFAGVNPQTGVFEFYDKDDKATATPVAADRVKDLVKTDPRYYGGISSALKYRGWSFDIFLEYKNQTGFNYLGNILTSGMFPGMMYNQPVAVLNRWQQPGDITMIQKFTSKSGTPAYSAAALIQLNNASNEYSDAAYLRVKNVVVSYSCNDRLLKKIKMEKFRLYLEAQNLFTLTRFKGADPETQNLAALPPLRTIAAGIQLTF